MTLPGELTSGLVGATFVPGYPDNVLALEAAWGSLTVQEHRLRASLVRNPENESDPNAVEVHVLTFGMLGHLPAALAARIAPELDAGQRWRCWIERVKVNTEHLKQPGVELRLERVREEAA